MVFPSWNLISDLPLEGEDGGVFQGPIAERIINNDLVPAGEQKHAKKKSEPNESSARCPMKAEYPEVLCSAGDMGS